MKNNVLYLLTLVFMLSFYANAQRGVRIAYIDTEYILENVPEYQEATAQLDDKAQKWKNEIQSKLTTVEQKRKDLSNEKALLTKELVDEREEDITFEENEILDYQQKRFGPNGDLFIQKRQLMQPIQDQIFAAVQDMAEGRKYDFIFDKSSDAVMLFSAKQFDVSEQVLRSITRTSKRKQATTKAERKAAEEEELIPEINEELEAREKALEEKKAERESAVEKRRKEILAAREAKKKEAEARRQKVLEDRENAKQAKLDARNSTSGPPGVPGAGNAEASEASYKTEAAATKTKAELIEENRQKKLAEREARKKALEERKKQILEERQKAKDSINNNN
ncbi:OmpH family outer membrane protein [Algibacter amylolyticus]|uniref:OmpH family outer membrane protein n=1 Tax=Algibacter amylolyticus TaxID=1608400 RepID=A0A5M7BKR1_9FLAO|nr:OmpH family outer membrane protein [Algibacter amylolyticus]KAA5827851.1 OmpH family outer membrane protein [Algibacter amylolyticus]MBB5267081.1 Skp family chaperone for outer membrane proteins [Algibacter amylolyticus]TSJ82096.1 OmpH family outer membrane protein [Algibacter amylolyticus]